MNRLASKLVVPLASTAFAALAALAACIPEESEPDYPIRPIGGPPLSSGTGSGDDNGGGGGGGFGADAGIDFGDGGFFDDGGFDFNDAPAVPLDSPTPDAGTILIPSDGASAPPFPEGDQIP